MAEDTDNALKRYLTRDPRGLAKLATKPRPWTVLHRELRKHVGDEQAKRMASQCFKDVYEIWSGDCGGRNPLRRG